MTQDDKYMRIALNAIYNSLGNEDINKNQTTCFENDIYKLYHEDIVFQDIYCVRKSPFDTISETYKKWCFNIKYQTTGFQKTDE